MLYPWESHHNSYFSEKLVLHLVTPLEAQMSTARGILIIRKTQYSNQQV